MAFLKSVLRASTLSIKPGFKLSTENWNAALNLLKERFDNKQFQIAIHMKNLLKILTSSNLKYISQLRSVYGKHLNSNSQSR